MDDVLSDQTLKTQMAVRIDTLEAAIKHERVLRENAVKETALMHQQFQKLNVTLAKLGMVSADEVERFWSVVVHSLPVDVSAQLDFLRNDGKLEPLFVNGIVQALKVHGAAKIGV